MNKAPNNSHMSSTIERTTMKTFKIIVRINVEEPVQSVKRVTTIDYDLTNKYKEKRPPNLNKGPNIQQNALQKLH